MSWMPSQDPVLGDKRSCDALELVIVPRARDIGGFEVRRALPHGLTVGGKRLRRCVQTAAAAQQAAPSPAPDRRAPPPASALPPYVNQSLQSWT